MRNPVRAKNLQARFLPIFVLGLFVLIWAPPSTRGFAWALPPIAIGLAIRSWGAGHLVKNDALTITGPYAYLRHPLYLGTLLIGTGFALLFGGRLSAALLALLWPWFAFSYFPRKDRLECGRLEERYGEAFARYRAAVPALWPRLWAAPVPIGEERTWALDRYSENNELGTLLAVLAGLIVFWLRAAAVST